MKAGLVIGCLAALSLWACVQPRSSGSPAEEETRSRKEQRGG